MSCISNSAYQTAETLRTAAALTNAVLKSAQLVYEAYRSGQDLIDNYRKQHELAKRAQAIAESIQGQQSMFWAAENQFKNEFTVAEPIENVEVMARRYAGRLVSTVLGGFATKIHEVKCNMNRYCTSANQKALQDVYLMRSFAVSAARTLGRNIAFAEYQARTDLNWERRKQAAALGRKLTGDASGLIKSAGAGLASIGAGHEQSFNSALKGIGLAMIRPDLAPERQASFAEVNAQYQQTNFQQDMSYSSSQNNDEYNYSSVSGYSSNGGSPMYGPESVNGTNNIASSLSANETMPPSDLIGEGDLRGVSDGPYTDDQDLYRDGSNQNFNGPVDRVRRGSVVFDVVGGNGGKVRVDLDKFEVGYADHLDANEVKAVTPQNPNNWPT
jgi:hypothetical protein